MTALMNSPSSTKSAVIMLMPLSPGRCDLIHCIIPGKALGGHTQKKKKKKKTHTRQGRVGAIKVTKDRGRNRKKRDDSWRRAVGCNKRSQWRSMRCLQARHQLWGWHLERAGHVHESRAPEGGRYYHTAKYSTCRLLPCTPACLLCRTLQSEWPESERRLNQSHQKPGEQWQIVELPNE